MEPLYLTLLVIVAFIVLFVIFGSFFTVNTSQSRRDHEIRQVPYGIDERPLPVQSRLGDT